MSDMDINRMDFKQLRNEVQRLRDEVAIFMRKYNDTIYNLDKENFSNVFTAEQDDMKAQIEITADAIRTMVSDTDLHAELKKYSTIEQTAEQIKSTVTKEFVTPLIGDDYVTNATFTSTIKQTAEEIESIVSKNISAYFTRTSRPTASNTSTKEQSMLCLYNDTYYYFNDVTNKWTEYPASGLSTMFRQTASGFELIGDTVSVSGDLISGGTISGIDIRTSENEFGDGVRLNSSTQSIEVMYTGAVVAQWGPLSIPGGSTLHPVGGSTLNIKSVYATGDWSFSDCDTVSFGKNAPVAIFG